MYGDPLFDIARFTMSGPTPTDAFLTGYALTRTLAINTPSRSIAPSGP